MGLTYIGKLEAKRLGEFEGRKFASLDFLDKDRFGGLNVTHIYLPDGYDHSGFKVGADVEVPVVAMVNKGGKLTFRLFDPSWEEAHPQQARPKVRNGGDDQGSHPNAPGQR
jgi:hypothetical protein